MKLSIITVNLNNHSGLKNTVESVICQDFTDYELIIIDGGSTDGSREIIEQYKNHLSYYVSEPDNGIYDAMNKGIRKASGEYCFFLNSGDYLLNMQVLKKVFSHECQSDIIYGNLVLTFNGQTIGKIVGRSHMTFLDVYSSSVKHQATFIRTNLFEKFGFYDETLKISADWAFFMKSIGLGGATFSYLNTDIASFDNDGLSNNNPEICINEKEAIINQYLPAMMQEDYVLLKKFSGIRIIEKSKIAWLLYRVLVKFTRVLVKL